MPETHDYPTKTIKAKELTSENVLVGSSGGLSAVIQSHGTMHGYVSIVTEHGSLKMAPDQDVTVYHDKLTPEQIGDRINAAATGTDDSSVWEGIDALVEDLLDSVALAMGAEHEDREALISTVRDYYVNHYSDL